MDPQAPFGPAPAPRASSTGKRSLWLPLGDVLGRSFLIFARWSWVLIPLAALFYALPTWMHLHYYGPGSRIPPLNRYAISDALESWLPVATVVIGWALALAFQAVVAYAVFQSLRGTPVRWGSSIAQGLRRLPHAVGASLLILLAMTLPSLFVLYRSTTRYELRGDLGMLLILGFIAFLAPRFFVGVQVAVVEGANPVRALSRSARLTRGARWHVFAILLVVHVVPYLLTQIASSSLIRVGIRDDPDVLETAAWMEAALGVVFAGLQAVTAAVTYHVLRQRKEGVSLNQLLAVFD